jgi:hypothetical protein
MNVPVSRSRLIVLLAAFLALSAGSSLAGPGLVRVRAHDLASIRREIPVGARKEATLPLVNGNSTLVQLERFEVFAPDAKIIQHTPSGDVFFPIPTTRFYRGQVVGDKESMVFLAVGDNVNGLVVTQGHVFNVEPDRALAQRDLTGVQVREIDPNLDFPVGAKPFTCDLDHWSAERPIDTIRTLAKRAEPLAASLTTTYLAKVSIEIDDELFALAPISNNTTNAANYAAQLVGGANVIYNRDLKTNLTIGTLHTYGGGSDPWTANTTTLAALAETRNVLSQQPIYGVAIQRSAHERQEPWRRCRLDWNHLYSRLLLW